MILTRFHRFAFRAFRFKILRLPDPRFFQQLLKGLATLKRMRQKDIAAILTLLLLALFLSADVSVCFAQDRPVPASNEASGKSGATPGAPDKSSPQQDEGCKLGTYTGTIPLTQVPYYVAGEEDLRGGMTCSFRINSKLPLFTFHFFGQPDNDSFGDLDITVGSSSEEIQTIENTTDPSLIAPVKAESVLTVADANFDGYRDLQILSQCGATGNCSYDFYLYDPKAKQFIHNDFLSSLGTPSFDQAKKQVTTSSNGSASDWQNETYQHENDGRYTLIHREVSAWDRERNTVTVSTYELRNGQMQLVSSETSPE
jgi:hypothetical protein